MTTLTFKESQARIQGFYQQGDYQAAYDLATRLADHFPEQHLLFQYWRMSAAARMGDHHQVLEILATEQQQGNWYADLLLRKNPSFQSLQGLPEFVSALHVNQELRRLEFQQIFPLLTIHSEDGCRSPENQCPLLVALHDHASTAQADIEYWQPAALAGWLVAAPQSSQAMWRGAYVWDDNQITLAEFQNHIAHLSGVYAIDPNFVILGGKNTGAMAALQAAMSGALPATGFFALMTAGAALDADLSWDSALRAYTSREGTEALRGYAILAGYDDETAIDALQSATEAFNQAGIPAAFEIIPPFDQPNSPEYEQAFQNALEFLQEPS